MWGVCMCLIHSSTKLLSINWVIVFTRLAPVIRKCVLILSVFACMCACLCMSLKVTRMKVVLEIAWLYLYKKIYNISLSVPTDAVSVAYWTPSLRGNMFWFNKLFTEAYWSDLDIADYGLKKLINLTSLYKMRSFKCMAGNTTKHSYK